VADRRIFIHALAAGLLAAPSIVSAQQTARVWRIGFLAAASRETLASRYDAFLMGMRDLGYVEGKNLLVEARFADGQYDRLPGFAAELVQLKPDVIVAVPSPAIRAAQEATTTIPIVFPSTGDPVGSGFVASLARPGGNLTGLSNSNLDVAAKTLDLLKTMLPNMSGIAILANPGSSTEAAMLKNISAMAQKMGVRVLAVEASTPEQIEAGFVTMDRNRADAVIVGADALMGMQQRQIAQLAMKYRLPSISQGGGYGRAGGLMGYGLNNNESYRRAAVYVDKILKGAKPGQLPVEQPTKLELVINLRTAKALGLTIPQSLLLRADEVIQ
jgi:putative ABC transport system substrate-binding protein